MKDVADCSSRVRYRHQVVVLPKNAPHIESARD